MIRFMKECWRQQFAYEDIRVILMDFDGILYSTPTFDHEYARYLSRAVSELSINKWDKFTAFDKLLALRVIGGHPYDRTDIRTVCESDLGVLLEDYDVYRLNHPFMPRLKQVTVFDAQILRRLSQRCTLILVTNDSLESITHKAQRLNIDLSVFHSIMTPDFWDVSSFDKFPRYHKVVNTFLLHGTEIYAIGTNYHADLTPILESYGAGLFVDTTQCRNTQMFLEDKFLGGKNGFV